MPDWKQQLEEYRRVPGLQQSLSKVAGASCAPFWWSYQERPGQRATIMHNGTVCFINTGYGRTRRHCRPRLEKVPCRSRETRRPKSRVPVWGVDDFAGGPNRSKESRLGFGHASCSRALRDGRDSPVGLELPILALNPGLSNVARRRTSVLR
jgi:hypothetical protein